MNASVLETFPPELSDDDAKVLLRSKSYEEAILGTMREALRYSRKCCRGQFEDGELISVCYDAMNAAAPKYNEKFGISFFAFAKQYIRGGLSKEFKKRDPHQEEKLEAAPEGSVELDFGNIDLKERLAVVWPVVERRLNPIEFLVVVLRYRSGFSFEEISRLRGVSRQAIQRTHCQALKKLKRVLAHKML